MTRWAGLLEAIDDLRLFEERMRLDPEAWRIDQAARSRLARASRTANASKALSPRRRPGNVVTPRPRKPAQAGLHLVPAPLNAPRSRLAALKADPGPDAVPLLKEE